MRRLFGVFRHRWLISLLGVIAVSLLIWFAGPLIAVAGWEPLASPTVRMLVILVLVVLWGLSNLRRQVQAKKANEQLADGLVAADQDEGGAAGQSVEEVAILKERFAEAMEVLKSSKRKGGGARSLYELPWYIIIGPPGSGKTTALIHSGLDFPLAERFGKEALAGVGGTRNCDWWFTNEAVLLDTAGRYVTQDSHGVVDSAGWEGFLDLLKKNRRRRPINGVMVAISLSDLMLQSEQERQHHVRAIKQRVQELTTRLGIRFPVYVMFTKTDLVPGFMEFFDDLGRDERAQVWGMTFPVEDQDEGGVIRHFGEEFDALLGRLNERLIWRLNQERDLPRRTLIYGFPQQMASLKDTLADFLGQIFRPSRFEERPMLRGVYFTSGTQEGTPIDRVMGALARNFGLGRQALAAFGGKGRSYFINFLLRRVAFAEAALAGANRRFERQRAWLQRGTYAGALTATVLAALAWSASYTGNQTYITRMQEAINGYDEAAKAEIVDDADFAAALPRLDALRKATEVYREHQEQGVPWLMGMGLYQGRKLTSAAQDAYLRELGHLLLPRIALRVKERLRRGGDNPDFQYEALKLYLMLGEPERLDPDLLKLWTDLEWKRDFPADPEVQGRLQAHLATAIEAGIEPVEIDRQLVEDVRLALNQVPLAELVYGRLKREALAEDESPFRVSDAIGGRGSRVFRRASGRGLDEGIPGLFTYRGFFQVYQVRSRELAGRMRKESWVLGKDRDDLSRAELKALDQGVLSLYLDDYIKAWDGLLKDLEIVPFRSLPTGVEELDILSGSGTPLRRLLQAVDRNTSLTRLPPTAKKLAAAAEEAAAQKSRLARLLQSDEPQGGARSGLPGEPVDQHFQRLNALVSREGGAPPLNRIIDLLSELYGQLNTVASGEKASGDLARRLEVEAARQPEPVKRWLQQLASNAKGVVRNRRTSTARGDVEGAWVNNVLPICRRALERRYPFDPAGARAVTLADFGRFFGAGGVLDRFFQEHLKSYVDTSASPWRWRAAEGIRLGLNRDVLRQFETAADIRDTFFADGGKEPSVRFALKPVALDAKVTRFLLDLDGQRFTYRHGPARLKNAVWPSPDGTGQVRVVFEDAKGRQVSHSEEGPWAWFRLLDRSELRSLGRDRLLVTFEVERRTAKYEIHASSVINPFQTTKLQGFRCIGDL